MRGCSAEGTNTEINFQLEKARRGRTYYCKKLNGMIAHEEAGIEGAFNGLKGEISQLNKDAASEKSEDL